MAKKKATRKSAKPRPARKRSTMVGADFLSLTQRSPADVVSLLQTAAKVKRNIRPYRRALEGTTTVLLFEKSSLRTRITFETGINALGGTALYMDHANQRLGERESVRDYGKNLERWVDCVVARVYRQSVIEELADNASIPIINALSDRTTPARRWQTSFHSGNGQAVSTVCVWRISATATTSATLSCTRPPCSASI